MPHAANHKQKQHSSTDDNANNSARKRSRDNKNDRDSPQRKRQRRAKQSPSDAESIAPRATNTTAEYKQQSAIPKHQKSIQPPSSLQRPTIEDASDHSEANTVELLVHGRERRWTAGRVATIRLLNDPLDAFFDEDEDDSDFEDDNEESPVEDMNMDIERADEDDTRSARRKTKGGKMRDKSIGLNTVKEESGSVKTPEPASERTGSPEFAENQLEYLVDTLLQYRLDRTGHEQVLVRWQGFPKAKDHTWEDVEIFRQDCGPAVVRMLQEFLPRARLDYFQSAHGNKARRASKPSRRSMP